MLSSTLGAQADLFGGDEFLLDSLLAGSQLALKLHDTVIAIDMHGFARIDVVTAAPHKTDRGVYMVRLLHADRLVRLFRVFPARALFDSSSGLPGSYCSNCVGWLETITHYHQGLPVCAKCFDKVKAVENATR